MDVYGFLKQIKENLHWKRPKHLIPDSAMSIASAQYDEVNLEEFMKRLKMAERIHRADKYS